jgi:hypothetical protein
VENLTRNRSLNTSERQGHNQNNLSGRPESDTTSDETDLSQTELEEETKKDSKTDAGGQKLGDGSDDPEENVPDLY